MIEPSSAEIPSTWSVPLLSDIVHPEIFAEFLHPMPVIEVPEFPLTRQRVTVARSAARIAVNLPLVVTPVT
jgi:hypothetical protein